MAGGRLNCRFEVLEQVLYMLSSSSQRGLSERAFKLRLACFLHSPSGKSFGAAIMKALLLRLFGHKVSAYPPLEDHLGQKPAPCTSPRHGSDGRPRSKRRSGRERGPSTTIIYKIRCCRSCTCRLVVPPSAPTTHRIVPTELEGANTRDRTVPLVQCPIMREHDMRRVPWL